MGETEAGSKTVGLVQGLFAYQSSFGCLHLYFGFHSMFQALLLLFFCYLKYLTIIRRIGSCGYCLWLACISLVAKYYPLTLFAGMLD